MSFDRQQQLLSLSAIGVTSETTSPEVDTRKSDITKRPEAIAVLDVTVLSGGNLVIDFKLTGTVNGVEYDIPSGGFTQITATGAQHEAISIPVLPQKVKVTYAVAGNTPNPALTATVQIHRP